MDCVMCDGNKITGDRWNCFWLYRLSKSVFDVFSVQEEGEEREKRDDDDDEKFNEEKRRTNDVYEEHVGSWRDIEIRDLRKVRVTAFGASRSFKVPTQSVPSTYSRKHTTARGGIEIKELQVRCIKWIRVEFDLSRTLCDPTERTKWRPHRSRAWDLLI